MGPAVAEELEERGDGRESSGSWGWHPQRVACATGPLSAGSSKVSKNRGLRTSDASFWTLDFRSFMLACQGGANSRKLRYHPIDYVRSPTKPTFEYYCERARACKLRSRAAQAPEPTKLWAKMLAFKSFVWIQAIVPGTLAVQVARRLEGSASGRLQPYATKVVQCSTDTSTVCPVPRACRCASRAFSWNQPAISHICRVPSSIRRTP